MRMSFLAIRLLWGFLAVFVLLIKFIRRVFARLGITNREMESLLCENISMCLMLFEGAKNAE